MRRLFLALVPFVTLLVPWGLSAFAASPRSATNAGLADGGGEPPEDDGGGSDGEPDDNDGDAPIPLPDDDGGSDDDDNDDDDGGGNGGGPDGGDSGGGNPPPTPNDNDNSNCNPNAPKEGTASDPVGYISGNVYETVTDLRIPCPDIDLVFRRAYSSHPSVVGDLGYGWFHSYDWRVFISGSNVVVHASGEDGVSDMDHTFRSISAGGTVVNADGYWLSRDSRGRYILVTPGKTRYAFTSMGLLSSITTWNGTQVKVERGRKGKILKVRHSNGKELSFSYGGNSLECVRTQDRSVWVDFVCRNIDGLCQLERVVRHDGGRSATNEYTYVSRPRPGTWRSPLYANLCFGVKTVATKRSPPVDPRRHSGNSKKSTSVPVLSRKVDANGIVTSYEYDRLTDGPRVRCRSVEMTDGLFASEFSYYGGCTVERKPTAFGVSKTRYDYDSERRETSRWTGDERKLTTYDSKGNATKVRQVNWRHSLTVRRKYDGWRRIVGEAMAFDADPVRWTQTAWDNRRGTRKRVETPEGRVQEWMERGKDVIVFGAGHNDPRLVTRRIDDMDGHPRAIIGPDGGRTDFSYHDDGTIAAMEPKGLPRIGYAYDTLGHLASVTRPGPGGTERTVSYVNNCLGFPMEVSYPDGSSESFAYDGGGTKVVRRTDALGREDVYRWTLGIPVHAARVADGVTNALYSVSHDQQLNVVAVMDPLGRRAESYVLDENERVIAVTNLEGQVLKRRYALGKMVESETRFDGSPVRYRYGADARLSSATYPDCTLRFGYDGDGLLTSASDRSGFVSNAYDAATGWLDASRGTDGTWVRYVRSNGGAVTSRVSVAGTERYAYDRAGRRTRTVSPVGKMSFGYCQWNGRLAAVTNANGVVTAYAYDVMDRVTNVTWMTRGGNALGGFGYGYDAAGRIVSRRHALGTNRFDRAYAYDGLDRLVSDGGVSYAYDAAGNRTAKRGDDGGDVAYALGAGDRLAAWTGGAYEHDAAGCVTHIVRGADTWDLTWNWRYQLVSVATNGAFAESYSYDALGRHVSTVNAEGTERHVYDENWQAIADIDGDGNVIRSYEWGEGMDQLLAVRIGSRTYMALTDIQGTVWGYADGSGAVVAHWTYDAWGNVLSEEIADGADELRTVRYRFHGRERSAATGLVNFRMRWYDPVTGRWLSKDPIGLIGGLNLYAFCEGNPVNNIDCVGLCDKDVGGLWPKIKNAIKIALGACKSGAGPAGTGEAADALNVVPISTAVLGMGDEIRNATEISGTEGFGDSESGLKALSDFEQKFRKWSNAASNQADMIE